eukprot:10556204-Alexandrium_andersonii.AAC.1
MERPGLLLRHHGRVPLGHGRCPSGHLRVPLLLVRQAPLRGPASVPGSGRRPQAQHVVGGSGRSSQPQGSAPTVRPEHTSVS